MKPAADDIDFCAIPGFREPVKCCTHLIVAIVFLTPVAPPEDEMQIYTSNCGGGFCGLLIFLR
jgi:hypothetical protein